MTDTIPSPLLSPSRGAIMSTATLGISPSKFKSAFLSKTKFNSTVNHDRSLSTGQQPLYNQDGVATAIVYCEANFGAIDGKTANGLVRHSQKYKIVSVIDSEKAGCDAGVVLGEEPNGISICHDLTNALTEVGGIPNYFIFGMAPASGMLSPHERGVVLEAIDLGMGVVSGLHEFLSDDPEFVAASTAKNVEIIDVRKPRANKDLHMFSGQIDKVTCPRIAVLGTDCAIGKRTTATILTRALNNYGLKSCDGRHWSDRFDSRCSLWCCSRCHPITILFRRDGSSYCRGVRR